jgi:hypothetical protein
MTTTYFRPDARSLVAIYECDPKLTEGVTHHSHVSGSGHGTTVDESLDSLVARLRQLADLIEHRAKDVRRFEL